MGGLTFMEDIANRRIVENDNLAQIRFNTAQVFDVSSIAKGTVLSVVPASEILLFLL